MALRGGGEGEGAGAGDVSLPPPAIAPYTFASPFYKVEYEAQLLVDCILYPFTLNPTHHELKKVIEKDVQENYEAMVNPKYFTTVNGQPVGKYLGGSEHLVGPMHTHPKSYIKISNADSASTMNLLLGGLKYYDQSIQSIEKTRLEKLMSYWTSVNSLKLLHSFLDRRHVRFQTNPDILFGTNLLSNIPSNISPTGWKLYDRVEREWELQRLLLRTLHLPGMVTMIPDEDTRIASQGRLLRLARIYEASRGLLESEKLLVETNAADAYDPDPSDVDFDYVRWIATARTNLLGILEEVLGLAYEEPPRSPTWLNVPRRTREEIFAFNTGPEGRVALLDRMLQRFDKRIAAYPLERLVLDILDKEDTFERTLAVEHIEDKLVNKQISILDEENISSSFEHHPDKLEQFLYFEHFVYRICADIALTNRQRRNFRLLRDWQGVRPWANIFQLYDPSRDGCQWQADAIRQFWNHHTRDYQHVAQQLEPTSYCTVSEKLFGFLPLNLRVHSPYHPDHICFICQEDFEGGEGFNSTMVRLHCAHNFHLKCIFDYWDEEGKYLHRCPIPSCRKPAKLNFCRFGIDLYDPTEEEFVHNVWNYEKAASVCPSVQRRKPAGVIPLADDLYDVPPPPPEGTPVDTMHEYWMRENLRILLITKNALDVYHTEFPPFKPTNMNADPEYQRRAAMQPPRYMDGVEAMARNLRSLYSAMRHEQDPDLAPENVARLRILEASRSRPQAEAAFMRMKRRRRDRARRAKVADEKKGLAGLPGA